jgi:hypothetical protein
MQGSKMPMAQFGSKLRFALACLLASFFAGPRLAGIVITEIQYHPPAADEAALGGRNLEWIEIYNDDPTVVNLSGWHFSNGIDFVFPFDTYIPGRSYLVVAADAEAVRSRYGITNVIGDFAGRLDNDGETIELAIFGGGTAARVSYSDRNQWPQAADGAGHTLALKDPALSSEDNDNWTQSAALGGTPGAANFAAGSTVVETVIFDDNQVWRYLKGTAPFPAGWQNLGFNDDAWLQGATGIGYADGDDRTELTDMQNGYVAFAARKTLTLTQAQIDGFDAVVFQVSYDDGFVAYLNGEEFARASMGAAGSAVTYNQSASTSHEAAGLEPFTVPKSKLRAGENVFAVQVHNAGIGSTDVSFVPRLVSQRVIEPGGGGAAVPVVINECFWRTDGERWVELYNASSSSVDLSGFHLSDERTDLGRYAFPAGTVIGARAFLKLTEAETALAFAGPMVSVYLSRPDLDGVVDAQVFEGAPPEDASLDGTSDALYPDGGSRLFVSTTPTPAAPNAVERVTDLVINELLFNPPADRQRQEFVELHNRGAEAIDISGFRFTRGINFTFPSGAIVPGGGYVVVALDPSGLVAHALPEVFGPYTGTLSDSGELVRIVDALGNLVDEVDYLDGGAWPSWADGGGSSLELIDPFQDNSVASAWEASDESPKSEWQLLEYDTSYTQQQESELAIRMLSPGEILIDAIEISRGATQYLTNGDFEANTSGWRIEGNHIRSQRTTESAFQGSASLKIVCTGGGDTRVNRIERDTTAMVSGTYRVRMGLRWLRGSNLIQFAGFRESPEFQRVHWLSYPSALGSPGRRNSRAAGNLGPVISEVQHLPAVPAPNTPATILARVSDSGGVASVAAKYRTGSPIGTYSSATLFDDGSHSDGEAGDGLFGGQLPAQGTDVKVVYYIEARDALGAVRTFPAAAPSKTLVFQHATPLTARGFTARIIHDDAAWSELNTRQLHSDELLDASFVFNESQVMYNVGTRFRGSPWNRLGNPRMYRVRFGRDATLRGKRSTNVSRYGSAMNERAAGYAVWRNSTASTTSPFNWAAYTRVRTAAGVFTMELQDPTTSDFRDLWFQQDSDGQLMKITGWQTYDDAGNHRSDLLSWATYQNRGANKASYRWNYNLHSNEDGDDHSALIALMQRVNSSAAVIDSTLEDLMDVEQFLRVYAARCAHDDWDTIAIGNGQNAYIYFAPIEGRWKLLPWDMDHSWSNVNARVYPDADGSFAGIINRPKFRRMYIGIINEMLNGRGGNPGFWSAAEMGAKFLTPTSAVVGGDGVGGPGGIQNYINSRRNVLAAQLPARVAFSITTSNGADFSVNSARATVEGNGWVDVHSILAGDQALELSWTTTTRWRGEVELEGGRNELTFLAFDADGALVGSDSIAITSTLGWATPTISAIEPDGAAPGELVTLSGTEFHNGIQVLFGATASPRVVFDEANGTDSLQAEVPRIRPGAVDVAVRNVDGRSSASSSFTVGSLPPQFIRGDINLDELVTVSDAVRLLGHLFRGLSARCRDAGDFNNDEVLNVTDAVLLLEFLFKEAAPPPAPFPAAGEDADAEGPLDCEEGVEVLS